MLTYGIVGATDQASAGDRTQTNVELPAPDVTAVIVDDAHQQVFVGGDSVLTVVSFEGQIVKTV